MLHSSPNKFKYLSMKYYKHTKRNMPKIERILVFGHNFFKASIFFQKTKQQIELNPTPTPSPPLSFLHPQKQAWSWIQYVLFLYLCLYFYCIRMYPKDSIKILCLRILWKFYVNTDILRVTSRYLLLLLIMFLDLQVVAHADSYMLIHMICSF